MAFEQYLKIDTNFKNLSNGDLILTVEGAVDILSDHPGFPLPWPDVVPEPKELKDLTGILRGAINAAANGDRQKIVERGKVREKLEEYMTFTSQYLAMVAYRANDPARLLTTGLPVKNRTSSAKGLKLAPGTITAKHGKTSGMVVVRAGKIRGAASYELQYCQEDPPAEDSWVTVGMFTSTNHMEVTGLEPAKKTSFRLPHDSHGPGPWSAPISIIVL